MVIHPELLRAYGTARTADARAAARLVTGDAAAETIVRPRRRSLAATLARCVTTRPSRRPTPTSSAR